MTDNTKCTGAETKLNIKISFKSLLLFALPTILSMVVINLYVTIDGAWVSNLINNNALAGLNISYPVVSLALSLGLMLATGGAAIVARKIGQGREVEGRRIFSMIILAGIVIGGVMTAVGYIFLEDIVLFLGADDSTFDYCVQYLRTFLIFIVPVFVNVAFNNFAIVAGKAKYALLCTLTGGIFNVTFDYIFMGLCGMGITGAALATGIGYCFMPLFFTIYFLVNRSGQLYFERPKFDIKVFGLTCLNGSSEMITNLSFGITTFLYNITLMNLVGSTGVAAITIILYAMNLLMSVFLGYSIGVSSIISYNYGKQDHDNLHKVVRCSIWIVCIIAVVTFTLSMLFADALVLIFEQSDVELQEMASFGFRIFSIGFLFMSLNVFLSNMFTALSDGITSGILAISRALVFTVLFILVLPQIFGLNGVWMANPLAEVCAFAISIFILITKRKKYHY